MSDPLSNLFCCAEVDDNSPFLPFPTRACIRPPVSSDWVGGVVSRHRRQTGLMKRHVDGCTCNALGKCRQFQQDRIGCSQVHHHRQYYIVECSFETVFRMVASNCPALPCLKLQRRASASSASNCSILSLKLQRYRIYRTDRLGTFLINNGSVGVGSKMNCRRNKVAHDAAAQSSQERLHRTCPYD